MNAREITVKKVPYAASSINNLIVREYDYQFI